MRNQEYSEQNVENLVMLCISREDAIECLRANQDNVDKAAEYFYSGGLERDRQTKKKDSVWDEAAFHKDNWDSTDSPTVPQGAGWDTSGTNDDGFQINVVDAHPSGGRSRAPSPIGPTFGPSAPTGLEIMDDELQRALKLSMEDERARGPSPGYNYGPQEHGVIGNRASPANTAGNFRPATQPHYDPSQWAMSVHTASNAIDEVELPSPQLRKREPGNPAFFKPSADRPALPGFLTIMHSIPAGRNSFLCPAAGVFEDYGKDKDWWNGHEMEGDKERVAKLYRQQQGTDMTDGDEETVIQHIPRETERMIFYGLQRYMAFLDGTERAYGSIDALPKPFYTSPPVEVLNEVAGSWLDVVRFFDKDSEVHKQANGIITQATRCTEGIEEDSTFTLLRITVQDLPFTESLYQYIDAILWSDLAEGEEQYFSKVADVITIQVEDPSNSEMESFLFDIPKELQMMRYQKEMKDHMALLRRTLSELHEKLGVIQRKIHKLQFIPKKSLYESDKDARKYLEASLDYFERVDPDVAQAANIKRVIEQIDEKVKELNETKEQLQNSITQSLPVYTTSDEMPEGSKPHKLVGVIPDPYTYYMLIDHHDPEQFWEITFTRPPQYQGYLPSASSFTEGYTIRKVHIDDVIVAVRTTTEKIAQLFYATDDAYTVPVLPLPKELETFVREDNLFFYRELHPPPTTTDMSPISPTAGRTLLSPIPRHSSSSLIRQLTPDSSPQESPTNLVPIISINEKPPAYDEVISADTPAPLSRKVPPSPVDTTMRDPSLEPTQQDENDGAWEARALNLNEGGVKLNQVETEMKEVKSSLSPIKAAFGETRNWKGNAGSKTEEWDSAVWSDDVRE